MKILSVDTTAKTAAVAITDEEKLIASAILNTPGTHSVTMLPTVEALLKGSCLTIDDIDMFACSVGPGSFTGVRIGAALVKGLAFGSARPCVGVSSLEALARNLCMVNGIICPVMDARRNQLYNALFLSDGEKLTRLTEDRLLTAAELKEDLANYQHPVYFVGDGYQIAEKEVADKQSFPEKFHTAPEHCLWQNGYSVAMAALNKYRQAVAEGADISGFTAATLSPVSLRASQAEREREEKLKNT